MKFNQVTKVFCYVIDEAPDEPVETCKKLICSTILSVICYQLCVTVDHLLGRLLRLNEPLPAAPDKPSRDTKPLQLIDDNTPNNDDNNNDINNNHHASNTSVSPAIAITAAPAAASPMRTRRAVRDAQAPPLPLFRAQLNSSSSPPAIPAPAADAVPASTPLPDLPSDSKRSELESNAELCLFSLPSCVAIVVVFVLTTLVVVSSSWPRSSPLDALSGLSPKIGT